MINYYVFLYGIGCSYSDHTIQNYFDKYGNYIFPTDLITDTPNIAIGTPFGLSFLNIMGIIPNDNSQKLVSATTRGRLFCAD